MSRPPKILFLSNAMDISGGEVILIRLIENNPGIDAALVSPNPALIERLKPWLSDWVLMPELLPLRRRFPLRAAMRLLLNYPFSIFRIARISRLQKREVIMGGSFSLTAIAWLASRLAGIQAAWMHQHPVFKPGSFDARLAGFLIARGLFCVPCSQAMARPIRVMEKNSGRVMVIPNSVDGEAFDPARISTEKALPTLEKVPSTARRVALIAMITPWKGFHLLVEAAARLKQKGFGTDRLAFLLIGAVYEDRKEDQAYAQEVRELAARLEVSDQLFWLGKQEGMAPFYAASDVVLNCSVEPEPFGITIVEAMAMEKVVLVPQAGGPAEIVVDGMNGFLFEPKNAQSLAERLEWILLHLPELAPVRETARKSVQAHYDNRRVQGLYTAFFERMIEEKS